MVSLAEVHDRFATVLNLSQTKVPLPVTPVLRTFIKGDDVDTAVNEVLERRSGMPVTLARAGPPLNILSHCWFSCNWSICISSECHGRGFIFSTNR